ncbi:MAG TPA: EfeM/EfeO family lipoprotein [Polyangiaceae bacterium]|jgi:iron uptake system component EfeO|nr:EfeM/EfeO family lipoprotein [Polyangiaceae bacterium]
MYFKRILFPALALLSFGCSSSSDQPAADTKPLTDAQYEDKLVTSMHDALLSDLKSLHQAAIDLQAAAPTPTGRGWDADMDAEAIGKMKDAWLTARTAYERTEGALAPIFPDLDYSIDARYDDFLTDLGADGDQDLFDDQGVTGMHAMERILFVKTTPDSVIKFEATLPGYKEAAYPSTEDEANEFKTKLAARLVTDTDTLMTQWTPQKIDLAGAYVGLIDLMNEQREKVLKASTDEEESRYSQRTMHDVRDNLAGTRKIYDLFKPWLESKTDGKDVEDAVESAFDDLNATYDTVDGDAIPQPPADWSSETPTADNLATPFGKLFEAVDSAVDPNKKGSVVDGMTKTANAIGLQVTAE